MVTKQLPHPLETSLVLPAHPGRGRLEHACKATPVGEGPLLSRRGGPLLAVGLIPHLQPVPQQDLPFCSPFLPGITSTTPAHFGIFSF